MVPLTAAIAAGGLAGAAVSSISCGAFAPDSLLEYFLRLLDVAFISKLNVPLVFTIDVTSTLVQVLDEMFTALPIVAPTTGRLL